MTETFTDKTEFVKWHYMRDPTHVFFFHKDTFEWISLNMGFTLVFSDKRLTVLKKN